jgi:hypothetical protein
MKMNISRLSPLILLLATPVVFGQAAQKAQIKGNTEINVTANNMTAVATGSNNVAKNRVGVIQGSKQGDTKISAHVNSVTNVVGGRNRKSCVNIGSIVSDECK